MPKDGQIKAVSLIIDDNPAPYAAKFEFGPAADPAELNSAVARLLAHRIMVMQRGEVVETGLTDQVLDDPQHAYTQLLVSSVLQA